MEIIFFLLLIIALLNLFSAVAFWADGNKTRSYAGLFIATFNLVIAVSMVPHLL